jgi:serine O-acetyltransferase
VVLLIKLKIAPGDKIFRDIEIADGMAISVYVVVNKLFSEPNITIGGVPAKKISDKGTGLETLQQD